MIRVVLDTNGLVSASLFEKGRLAWIRHGWQGGRFTPVLAQPTTLELLRVLGDPKFDQVFLDLARAAGATALLSGDADLLALRNQLELPAILDPAGFPFWLQRHPPD